MGPLGDKMAFDTNDLTPHEQFVVERTAAGEIADFSTMAAAGGKPAVRAGFLRKLLLGLDPAWPVRTPGVRLKGARIDGALDLADCTGAGGDGLPALALIECDVAEPIDISHARLARLSLEASRLRRLIGAQVTIDGELNFSNASPLPEDGGEGTLYLRLLAARIGGDVRGAAAKLARAAGDGEFAHPSDAVLYLQGARIDGSLLLGESFEARGCLWLMGSQIGGAVYLGAAQLMNRSDAGDATAIVATNADIKGTVYLRDGFKAEGEIDFMGARIGGTMDICGAVLRNENGMSFGLVNAQIDGDLVACDAKALGRFGMQGARIGSNLDLRGLELSTRASRDTSGRALDAVSLGVGGALLLQGANIKGEVFLADARIDGYLAFGGGRFIHPGDWAIRAPNARIAGNLTFKISDGYAPHGTKTVIEGGAKFDRARIDGNVSWNALEMRGPGPDEAKGAVLSFADAAIAGPVQAQALTVQQDARIDFSGAECSALDDDVDAGWGLQAAELDIDGFRYDRFDSADARWRTRLRWLRRGARFTPQPYAQAAAVFARAGRREDARRILLAQHDARTLRASAGPLSWLLSSLFGLIAGYGLAPIRIVRALILFLAVGVAGVFAMNAQGALATPQGQPCVGAVEPALYAIDVALPVIDLGQASQCAPGRTARADLPAGIELGDSGWRVFEGVAMWRWAQALYALFGAILSALAVITFSGVLKPKDD